MNQFEAYSISDKCRVMIEVISKIRTDVRGHFTYTLVGISPSGKKVSTLVNKEQWDEYNVPIEEKEINKKIDRKKQRIKGMKSSYKRKTPIPKSQRKVYNEEIEKWLIEHYDLDILNE
jgi:hypothetical protein